jgi:hypothetical protein
MLGDSSVTFDVGPGALALLAPLVGVLVLIIQNHFTKKQTKVTATKAEEAAQELKPNGGASLRDAIDRIEVLVTDLASRVGTLEHERVETHTTTRITGSHDVVPTLPPPNN